MFFYRSPSSSRPRTPAFHAGNRGSNPLGDATYPPGDVAQLGERNAGSVEVRGSIPLVSTIENTFVNNINTLQY